MSKGWDNATLKKLKALTGKGLSTAEIGKRLGMSKNAVVGKLNRLGWNSKDGAREKGSHHTQESRARAQGQAPGTRQTNARTKTGAGGKNIRPRWQIIEQKSGHAPADYSTFPGNGEFKAEPMPLAHWRPRFRRFPFLWGYGLCGQTVLL